MIGTGTPPNAQRTSNAIDDDDDNVDVHKEDDMISTGIVLAQVGVIPGSLFTLKEQPTHSTTRPIGVCNVHSNSKMRPYQQAVLSIQRCQSILLTHSTNSGDPFPPLLP